MILRRSGIMLWIKRMVGWVGITSSGRRVDSGANARTVGENDLI